LEIQGPPACGHEMSGIVGVYLFITPTPQHA